MDIRKGIIGALLAAWACAALAFDAGALARYVERATADLPGRVEVGVGAPDARVDFSACRRLEPFLPGGARLWGRAWVGLRCVDGPPLVTYVPVEVQVHAPALLAARALAPGSAVGADDVIQTELDLTRAFADVLADIESVEDKVLLRPLTPGQPLRAGYFRSPRVVSAGDIVTLVYAGNGFVVAGQARAMGAAADGEPVRVQTPGGQTLSGTARPGRQVELGR